jgi:hypothetical protein
VSRLCRDNVEASKSQNPLGLHGLLPLPVRSSVLSRGPSHRSNIVNFRVSERKCRNDCGNYAVISEAVTVVAMKITGF